MPKTFIFIFAFLNQVAFAQIQNHPTQFDKFINQSKIEWAAYVNDSFYFNKAGLNDLLINRLEKKEIKASLPVSPRSKEADNINYLAKDSIDKIILTPGHKVTPIYDSNGNVIKLGWFQKNDNASIYNITEVTQILYIEKGQLKSYVPWVTPTLPLFMSSGKYLGESYYFNTAYNFKYNYRHRKRNNIVFLEQTNKKLKLKPADAANALKELYGKNLIETLWPYVLENKIDLFSVRDNKLINPADLVNNSGFTDNILVPLYDTASTIYKYEIEAKSITPKDFSDVVLIQDWYYNESKNIVFNKIKEMYLYISRPEKEEGKVPVPVLKLIFK